MTGSWSGLVLHRKLLFGMKVLKADILWYEHAGDQVNPKSNNQ